jgi:hypothetical protein
MTRTIILGAFAAIAIGFAAPAQASMANPGLGATALTNVEQAQYYGYSYGYRRHYRQPYYRSYAYSPRRCWTVFNGYRYVRRCR